MSDFHASLLLFIWFFLFVVACLTAIGTVMFLFEFLFGGCIGQDVTAIVSGDSEKRLHRHNPTQVDHRQATMNMAAFRSSFLCRDGMFLLHTISDNAGSVIAERVIVELWRSYQSDQSESHWKMEEHATREAAAHNDAMAGVRLREHQGRSHAAPPTGNVTGGQEVELLPIVAAAESQNFNHDPPAYDQAKMPQAATA